MHAAKAPFIDAPATPGLDLRPIAATLGILLSILGASMMVPALVDFSAGSGGEDVFLGAACVTIFVGVLMWMSGRNSELKRLDLRQAFLLTSSTWVVLTLFAALPFMWGRANLSFADAFFESMSGLTTTGASVMSGLDTMTPGILMWRALLHWFGGIGIVVIAIAVLPLLRIGGMQGLLVSYVLLTLLCAISYLLAGMTLFDAVTMGMSTLSSGGFANSDSSFTVFANPPVEYVAVVFMLIASLPFPLYARALTGDVTRLFTNSEVQLFLTIVAVFTLASFAQQSLQGVAEGEVAFRGALFTVASLISTTGFMAADYTNWGPLSDALFFVLMFAGGCTGSTSGGIKALRLAISGRAVQQHLKRIFYPNGQFPIRYGGAPVADDVVASVLGFIFLYLATFLVIATALNCIGLDLRTAFSAAIACLSNVGPGLGPVVGPASNYSGLPDAAIWLLSLAMLLGRLEILTVIVLVLPRFWVR
ncbi:MAG: potassium transporter TrkH [Rhizobiales bacterium 32-66-8]|nr:MAG: potassium transporter TrkH [Rhizobiales bacterium 32-66-8]